MLGDVRERLCGYVICRRLGEERVPVIGDVDVHRQRGAVGYVAERHSPRRLRARAAPTLPSMGVQRSAALPADVHRWLGVSGGTSTLTARAWRARGAPG
jgi:hypothetical protein